VLALKSATHLPCAFFPACCSSILNLTVARLVSLKTIVVPVLDRLAEALGPDLAATNAAGARARAVSFGLD
jgi:hypothetical protein